MRQSGPEALEQLALTQHDRRLVAGAAADVAGALRGLGGGGGSHQTDEQAHARDEQGGADGDGGGER